MTKKLFAKALFHAINKRLMC